MSDLTDRSSSETSNSAPSAQLNTLAAPRRTPRLDDLDAAAHAAASYVKPSAIAALLEGRTGLSAKGLAALHRLETNLAWELR